MTQHTSSDSHTKKKYSLSEILQNNFYLKEKAPEDVRRNVRAQAEIIEVTPIEPWRKRILQRIIPLIIVGIAFLWVIYIFYPSTRETMRWQEEMSTPLLQEEKTPEEKLIQEMKDIIMQWIESTSEKEEIVEEIVEDEEQ